MSDTRSALCVGPVDLWGRAHGLALPPASRGHSEELPRNVKSYSNPNCFRKCSTSQHFSKGPRPLQCFTGIPTPAAALRSQDRFITSINLSSNAHDFICK